MKEKDFVFKIKKKHLWAILAVIVIIAVVFAAKPHLKNNKISIIDSSDIIVLNDQRCKECNVSGTITQLKNSFPNLVVGEIDYMDEEGKKIYDESDLNVLPAVLFKDKVKDESNYAQVERYLEQKGDFLSLRIGASFDPEGEVCDNEIDDNGDGDIDCDDTKCKDDWKCIMPKKEKPEVELFVMSHCPFGTQIEKGILPVARLLGDKIDFKVRFCSYAMHGKKELDEQTLQHCIQKEYNNKYLDYLACFLKDENTDDCLKEVKLSGKLDSCIEQTDNEFKITEKFNDKSTWSGGRFPLFDVDKELNEKYGVRGSPNLVINGVTASVRRDPASLLSAICTGFKDKPAECNEKLSSDKPSPGFGFSTTSSTSSGSCG